MGYLISNAGIKPSANKKRISPFVPSLEQMDIGVDVLNRLQHSNEYEEIRVTRCTDALPTTPHSTLDTSTFAKLWKDESYTPFTY
ncbi:hypothetical protein TNCV_3966281 [Trichonephila clavipes]|nr:hypothetical protein TNCV_3966281 [Trichonephila clavipes]